MDYLDDMSKYQESANAIKKTRLTYGTIAVQLSKKNIRFQYKIIKKGARAAEYENAIEWLVSAGLLSRIYRNTQLVRAGFKSYFWRNDKGTKEVDFVISLKGKLIPVEVKSGEHVTAVSLNEYIGLFKPAYSIRISEKNFGFENNIKSVPLYAVFCICDD